MMDLRKIPDDHDPTLSLYCGTEDGALLVIPNYENMHDELDYYPESSLGIVFDTAEALAMPADIQRLVNVVALKADLKALANRPDRHRLIANTLEDIPQILLPSDLSEGSKKIISYTIAVFQLRWQLIRAALYSAMRSLQQIKSSGANIHVVTCGGAWGGVGGIFQILAAAGIRKVIENDIGLSDRLILTGVFAMPESESLDLPRISANTKATFDLLELGQRGEFCLPVTGNDPIKSLGEGVRLYDHVFAVGESSMTGAIPGHDAFRKVLSRFIWNWTGPIGDNIRQALVDPQYETKVVTL